MKFMHAWKNILLRRRCAFFKADGTRERGNGNVGRRLKHGHGAGDARCDVTMRSQPCCDSYAYGTSWVAAVKDSFHARTMNSIRAV